VKRLHTAASEVEAVMLRGLLEQAGIPVAVLSRAIPGYGVLVEPDKWGDIFVPDDREGEARSLVRDFLSTPAESFE
jgi:hypothetical protein